ncbi:T9SS type A sorting domain-containing protein [Segetibacter koreensis]|uniref:T9SS type A sorting domain-containing protein n=1 Tax=Segetibacter koreensis TaxID=398037 RepID=UPI00037C5194|nr:T9SS type A sorting domain-containing protein [Segetibacter koreensis]
MRKCLLLYVLLIASFAKTSFAQLLGVQKNRLLQIPTVHITRVSTIFVPVHIDLLKPIVVSLDHKVPANLQQVACDHLKKFEATLILKAERTDQLTASLQWETKYAFYTTGFDIERSLGDSLHFVPVNFAAASKAASFKINYHLPDINEYRSLSFYRIKQRNSDTSFTYSNIVSIKGYEPVPIKVYPIPIKIYPIPATQRIRIEVAPKQSGNAVIMVYDVAGKLVLTESTACTERALAVESIDISKFASGLYQLKILLPNKTFLAGKFIKK